MNPWEHAKIGREAIANASYFNTHRMVLEYAKLYLGQERTSEVIIDKAA